MENLGGGLVIKSCPTLATLWTVACQAPLSMGFSRGVSLIVQTVKSLSATWETWVQSLDWEDPLEKEMAIHSSILAWKMPWTEEPGRLQSMGCFLKWENLKTVIKKIANDQTNGKIFCAHGLGEIIMLT